MPSKKKVNDEFLIESYSRLNNVWLVGDEVGLCGQSVWERLRKLGLITKSIRNTDTKFKDWDILTSEYEKAVSEKGGLDALAKKLGRTKSFICRKAKELGLTELTRSKQPHVHQFVSEGVRKSFSENGHPKGMKGKSHTPENKDKYSKNSKAMWANPDNYLNSDEYRQKLSDRMTKLRSTDKSNNAYSRAKKGRVKIGDTNHFYRSSWEANIAAYLEFLKGYKEILNWEYEPETFWFHKIKRGVRSYMPDFRITNNDNSQYYIEVKGWMDDKSKTKLKRMKIYYPSINIEVIDAKRYKEISKTKSLYKFWGGLDHPSQQ